MCALTALGSVAAGQPAHDADARDENAGAGRDRRPRHASVLVEPEVRHHPDDADQDEAERGVVDPGRREPDAQGDRADDVERSED